MVETLNSLKHLGKCFFFDIEKTEGFLPGTELSEDTQIVSKGFGIFYNPLLGAELKEYFEDKRERTSKGKGFLANATIISVGKNYKGPLELPKGTEMITIYDLNKDRSQVVLYDHRFRRQDQDKTIFTTFANEMRSPNNRVEIKDIIQSEQKENEGSDFGFRENGEPGEYSCPGGGLQAELT